MRKSRSITLTLMAGFAAACSDGRGSADTTLSAASVDETRRCVDEQNRVVGDSLCARSGHAGGFYPFFYYGGRTFTQGGATYVPGGRRVSVGGGAPVYAPSQRGPVSRGGLGATAARRGGSFGG